MKLIREYPIPKMYWNNSTFDFYEVKQHYKLEPDELERLRELDDIRHSSMGEAYWKACDAFKAEAERITGLHDEYWGPGCRYVRIYYHLTKNGLLSASIGVGMDV